MMRKVGAWVMFGIAAFMLLGLSVSKTSHGAGVTLFTLALTVGLPIAVGISLLRGGRENTERVQQLRQQTIDAEILRLAIQYQGRLTPMAVMSALALSEQEVKKSLDDLVHRDIADLEVTDDGDLVYTFAEPANRVAGPNDARRLND